MNYERERRVKIPTRKGPSFYRLGQDGRTVLWHLHIEADVLGRIDVAEGDESRDIAKRLDLDPETFRRGLDRCFAEDAVRWETAESKVLDRHAALRGITECELGTLLIVDFVEAQKAKLSHALANYEYRERVRLAKVVMARHLAGGRVVKYPVQKITVSEAAALGLLNRAAAAHDLGVSIPTLRRRHEGQGLTVYRSELGEYLFKPDEVQALALKLVKALQPAGPKREAPSEQLGDPIWRERGARLAEAMGSKSWSRTEAVALGKRIGMKDNLVLETLAAAEGVELVKLNDKWTAAKGEK